MKWEEEATCLRALFSVQDRIYSMALHTKVRNNNNLPHNLTIISSKNIVMYT